MNILFVSSEFPLDKNKATGGIGTYLLNITVGLKEQGHIITVITRGDIRNIDKHRGVNVVLCNWGSGICAKFRKMLPFLLVKRLLNFIEYPLLFSFEAYLKINKITGIKKIDIIEGNDFGAELFFYLLLARKRPPVVLRLHTPSFVIQRFNNESLTLFYRLMKFLEVYCLKKANSLYSPTKSLASIISKEIGRFIKTIIPYPFKPLNKQLIKIGRKSDLVLYVGKLQPKKGVFLLSLAIEEVVKQFPQVKFIFVGPDTQINGKSVKKQLLFAFKKEEVEKNVIIKSPVNKRELYKLYNLASVTVIPSVWENFPNVCLEAMSQGSVVIASGTGGLKEIIKNNINGLLSKVGDSKDLTNKIVRLLKDINSRKAMSKIAQQDVTNRYNIDRITGKTLNYYRRVINLFNS